MKDEKITEHVARIMDNDRIAIAGQISILLGELYGSCYYCKKYGIQKMCYGCHPCHTGDYNVYPEWELSNEFIWNSPESKIK